MEMEYNPPANVDLKKYIQKGIKLMEDQTTPELAPMLSDEEWAKRNEERKQAHIAKMDKSPIELEFVLKYTAEWDEKSETWKETASVKSDNVSASKVKDSKSYYKPATYSSDYMLASVAKFALPVLDHRNY
jgi:hypothetical protein